MTAYEKLQKCYESVRAKVDFHPRVALVLGSGLGDYGDSPDVSVAQTLNYQEIEGFPISTVEGHRGRFLFGFIGPVPAVIMQGRVHYYEGYPMQDVVLPIRLMGMLGAKAVMLTNASGGINFDFHAGDFMLITDHIASFVPSPLIGPNAEQLGTRFPDMSEVYDKKLRRVIKDVAKEQDIKLQKGVYIQTTGPQFETPHEIKMYRIMGADAVGMSTACEAVAARHMGMRVCGISCVANLACGMTDNPLTHAEVQEAANKAAPKFKRLVTGSIIAMDKELA